MDRISRCFFAAALAAALGFTAAAGAADKPRPAASAPKSKDPVMSQAELRECLAQKDKLGQRSDAALKAKAEIVAAKTELDRTAAEIATEQPTLDRTKKDAVDAFNARIVARNALVEEYQAKAAAYNKEADDIQAGQAAYSSSCVNRRYDDRDLADIQRARK